MALLGVESQMRQFVSLFACVGLLAAAAFGCASGTQEGKEEVLGTDPGTSSFCEGYCARLHTCDEGKDEKTCTNACTNANAATLPKLRGDIVDLMSSCIEEEDCKTVLAGGVVLTCANEATASVAPSEAATSYCEKAAKAAKKCGKTVEVASCLTNAKLYNEAALADATECTEKACADVDECVDAALGSLQSTSTGTGTGTSGTSASSDDDDDPPPAPTTCEGVDTTTSCGACEAAQCCAEIQACSSNSSCVNFFDCIGQCPSSDTNCQYACQDAFPSGVTDAQSFATCVNDACPTECQ